MSNELTQQEIMLLNSVAKYAVRFTTAAEPYRTQREVLKAKSAQEAREIMQASDARVVDVTPIEQDTTAVNVSFNKVLSMMEG